MPATMRVRLYWQDGRIEELKSEIDASTTTVVRTVGDGTHRHFTFIEEIDDEGFAIFWENADDAAS